MNIPKLLLITVLALSLEPTLLNAQAGRQEKSDTQMFPAAQSGYKQVVIRLSPKKIENNYKVEISVGKSQMLDCNNYFMVGTIKQETLSGWGYPYYFAETNREIVGTKMWCPEDKKIVKFISMPTITIDYNSKLPVVLYIPSELDVRYRIWSSGRYEIAQQ